MSNTIVIASMILLWISVIALLLAVLGLGQQVGTLLERVAPGGALMTGKGLKPGEPAPELNLVGLNGEPIHIGGARSEPRSTLVFFLSPTCPMCDAVVPAVRSMARSEREWLDVILASDGDDADHAGYIRRKDLGALPYVVSRELGLRFRVGQLPHATLIGENGVVISAGLTNTREHLESLLEAKRRGVGSLQEYLAQKSQSTG
jgi:methylamine dehydrogenase accessory protein MauD